MTDFYFLRQGGTKTSGVSSTTASDIETATDADCYGRVLTAVNQLQNADDIVLLDGTLSYSTFENITSITRPAIITIRSYNQDYTDTLENSGYTTGPVIQCNQASNGSELVLDKICLDKSGITTWTSNASAMVTMSGASGDVTIDALLKPPQTIQRTNNIANGGLFQNAGAGAARNWNLDIEVDDFDFTGSATGTTNEVGVFKNLGATINVTRLVLNNHTFTANNNASAFYPVFDLSVEPGVFKNVVCNGLITIQAAGTFQATGKALYGIVSILSSGAGADWSAYDLALNNITMDGGDKDTGAYANAFGINQRPNGSNYGTCTIHRSTIKNSKKQNVSNAIGGLGLASARVSATTGEASKIIVRDCVAENISGTFGSLVYCTGGGDLGIEGLNVCKGNGGGAESGWGYVTGVDVYKGGNGDMTGSGTVISIGAKAVDIPVDGVSLYIHLNNNTSDYDRNMTADISGFYIYDVAAPADKTAMQVTQTDTTYSMTLTADNLVLDCSRLTQPGGFSEGTGSTLNVAITDSAINGGAFDLSDIVNGTGTQTRTTTISRASDGIAGSVSGGSGMTKIIGSMVS